MLKKKPPPCTQTKLNGDPCNGPRLTKAGIQKLLDQGIALVAAPEGFCSYHARTPSEQRRMSSRGGSHSPKRDTPEQKQRDEIQERTKLRAYELIRQLVDATIPNVYPVEPDVRKRALGVYIAAHLCAQPEDRMHFAHELLSRDLRHRNDIEQLAQDELRAGIDSLDEDEQKQAWRLLATA